MWIQTTWIGLLREHQARLHEHAGSRWFLARVGVVVVVDHQLEPTVLSGLTLRKSLLEKYSYLPDFP
jgi:hypothetical protein